MVPIRKRDAGCRERSVPAGKKGRTFLHVRRKWNWEKYDIITFIRNSKTLSRENLAERKGYSQAKGKRIVSWFDRGASAEPAKSFCGKHSP